MSTDKKKRKRSDDTTDDQPSVKKKTTRTTTETKETSNDMIVVATTSNKTGAVAQFGRQPDGFNPFVVFIRVNGTVVESIVKAGLHTSCGAFWSASELWHLEDTPECAVFGDEDKNFYFEDGDHAAYDALASALIDAGYSCLVCHDPINKWLEGSENKHQDFKGPLEIVKFLKNSKIQIKEADIPDDQASPVENLIIKVRFEL